MSDLQRNFAKAKLQAMPAPEYFDEAEEEGEEEQEADSFNTEIEHTQLEDDHDSSSASSASSASSTGTIIPSSNRKLFARPQGCVFATSP